MAVLGAGSTALALALTAAERFDEAEARFEEGIALERACRGRRAVAVAQRWYGDMLLRRGRPADPARARAVLAEAASLGATHGLGAVVREVSALTG
jgi:hypothetical protein